MTDPTNTTAAEPVPGIIEDFIDIFGSPSQVFARRARGGAFAPFLVTCLLLIGLMFVNRGVMSNIMDTQMAKGIAAAVNLAAAGRRPIAPDPFAVVATKLGAGGSRGPDSHLTPRERQVLRHLAFALDNDEIAVALSIGVETVKTHVHKLLQKMSLRDRTQAAVWAVRNGLA